MTQRMSQGGPSDFPPVKQDPDMENSVPTLTLIQFSKAPYVTFGCLKLGTSKSTILRIHNPTEDVVAEVTVDKFPSSKGFFVDHKKFSIQPEGSFNLTITWTPSEEGGIRELIVFNANGVLKHRAVVLGRAEAPQKKKRSLWDSIKNKRVSDRATTLRRKRTRQSPTISTSRASQISRKPQFLQNAPRSPLSSLNKPVITKDIEHHCKSGEHKPLNLPQRRRPMISSNPAFEGYHNACRECPDVFLVPAITSMAPQHISSSPQTSPHNFENGDHGKVSDKTLSPIGTPLGFKTCTRTIESSPLSSVQFATNDRENMSHAAPILSVTDALALINSDQSIVSRSTPCDRTYDFSDSLDATCGNRDISPRESSHKTMCISPEEPESNNTRLTYFVSKNIVVSEVPQAEIYNPIHKIKKNFTSATVIKKKVPAPGPKAEPNPSSGSKEKKSRRKLLGKTLQLSGSSHCESRSCSPFLPFVHMETRYEGLPESVTAFHDEKCQAQGFPSSSPAAELNNTPIPITSPQVMSPITFLPTSPLAVLDPNCVSVSSVALLCWQPCDNKDSLGTNLNQPPPKTTHLTPAMMSPALVEESFPVVTALNNKKRKSEVLKFGRTTKDNEKTRQGKRSRVSPEKMESGCSGQERRSAPRHHTVKADSVYSVTALSKMRSAAPAKAKRTRCRPASQGILCLTSSSVKVAAVAQSKLNFVEPAPTAIPRHPMPFAAKNMFYDERWIEKEERGFTWWLNYVLTPDDFKVNLEVTKVCAVALTNGCDAALSVPNAPTKEELSFSTYMARRKLNSLRRSACQLFNSEAMVKAIQRLELEVEAKRLLVRKDRHLWKDIGERQKVLNWLLSYNPLWLRIGLETIYGELIPLESNSDALGLALFILGRLLWNPDIAAEFRHPRVPHLYKDGHEEALSRFTLKKLLLLVCFLDKAKESRLIEHDPCLFCMDSEFKTSKDLLLAFSRDFLSGEGILPRHLGFLGLPVCHRQMPMAEFNFAVKNLAVDLKCGIRLVRVVELLMQDWSLSAKLRVPAVSRLQKVHNVDIALQLLKSKGIDLKDDHGSVIKSKDIVDGHRERTLSLLWKIIFTFQVEVILDEDQLRKEISFLKTSLGTKRQLAFLRANQDIPESPAKTTTPCNHGSMKITLLMAWVRAVCDFYNLRVENFTVSFSDGRILCLLIHHYHPSLLQGELISHCTTQTVECSHRGQLELDCSTSDLESSFDSSPMIQRGAESSKVELRELLENESNNFRLVNAAVTFLGGVPAMINPSDMSNTIPNEKIVMSYLSFLCSRLLDLRNEARSARVIQDAWRKYKLKKDLELYQGRHLAAQKIQSLIRKFLRRSKAKRQNDAATIIQSVWRSYIVRKALRQKRGAQVQLLYNTAATTIQAQWRMFSITSAYQRLKHYTIIVQAQWRMQMASKDYRRVYMAVIMIQSYYRAWALGKRERKLYLTLRSAIVKVQRVFKKWKMQKTENQAAIMIQIVRIQSWFRMQRCFHQYRKLRRSTVLLQAQFRGCIQRRSFHLLRQKHLYAIVIQSVWRGYAVRKQLSKMLWASVMIQRWFRANMQRDVERQLFLRVRHAAITTQAAFRGKSARRILSQRHEAATVIQAAFKMYTAQKCFNSMRKAANIVQQKYRATCLARNIRKDYHVLKCAAVAIQAAWRGRAHRKMLQKQHQCATKIQANYRRCKQQYHYRRKRAAVVMIQWHFRTFMARKVLQREHLQKTAAAVALQAIFRGRKVRVDLKKRHHAATLLQSKVRMFLCRRHYWSRRRSAIVLQHHYRAFVEGKRRRHEYSQLKQASVVIQAAFRGFRVRDATKKRHKAAVAIQSQFRMHKVRMSYLATKCAALVVQERYRAKRLRDEQMESYRAMKTATVIIQAVYRGHRARANVAAMHQSATVIQRWFLTIQERKQFLVIRGAALTCQQRYRAERKKHLGYLHKCRAVTTLQAAYRGYRVRRSLQMEHMAATKIQSHVRKYLQQTNYKKLCWAASLLQEHYRNTKKMKTEMGTFTAMRNAAITVQAAFRRMKSRKFLQKKNHAVNLIQRVYRAGRERNRYLSLRSSVVNIQRRFRATSAAKAQQQQYQKLRRAAITIQAAFRGQRVRQEVAHRHQAAIVIQATFRCHTERVKFQAIRLSAIIIQRYYRACILHKQDRRRFLQLKHSAIVLQSAFRGHCVRSDMTKMHKAATVLQAHFKRHQQQLVFKTQRRAAIVVQHRFRAKRQKCIVHKEYNRIRQAVITLQAAYRGMRSRRCIQQKKHAANVIQRAYRAHHEYKQYVSVKSSVLKIQEWFRARTKAKAQQQLYRQMRSAAITLQAAFRGQRVRHKLACWHQAATVIQSTFRQHREKVKFQAMRLSAIIIQRRYRACILNKQERSGFLQLKHSAIVLQSAFRGHCVRSDLTKMRKAATVLQAHFKRHTQQLLFKRQQWAANVIQHRFRAYRQKCIDCEEYRQIREAVITLQAAYRGIKSRRCIQQKKHAAVVIQRAYRAHYEYKQYMNMKSSVLKIQQWYRGTTAAKVQQQQFLQKRRAANTLQAAFRGHRVRQELAQKHQAATVIQSSFRRHREQVRFQSIRLAAIIIQRHYSAYNLQRQYRTRYLKTKKSAIFLQAVFRGWCVRKHVLGQNQAALLVQSWWKGLVQRRNFLQKRNAVVILQRRLRASQYGKALRDNYNQMRCAAITLQRCYRLKLARQQMLEAARTEGRWRFTSAAFFHLSAIKIQRAIRARRALQAAKMHLHCIITIQCLVRAKQQRKRYLEECRKVTVVQRCVKRWLAHRHEAASIIQQAIRRFLLIRRKKRVEQGIVKAQALWRGHRSRQLNDNPNVMKLRHHLTEISARVQEGNKLCNKMLSALDCLLEYKHFSHILEALKNLETATKLSPECCVRLVESGATNVIFRLIRSCNRSVPCMDAIIYSVQILLNLSKYHKTIEAVYTVENSVETLLDLLQRYRERAGDKVADKGGSIFTKSCFLLALLLQDKHRAAVVMKLPKALDKIHSIYRLTARKHKMDAERTVIKQKMNMSLNSSLAIQATPRKSPHMSRFAPEWELRKDKLKDIVNPLQAIQMVAEALTTAL